MFTPGQGGVTAAGGQVLFMSEGTAEQEINSWIGSDADAIPICSGEERAERESEAVDLPLELRSPMITSSK